MVRKPKIEPTFDYHLSSAFKDEDILALVLKGHLVIEAMLGKILEKAGFGEEIWRWPFLTKVEKSIENSPMPQWVGDICNDLNDIRNDYCHSLGHEVSFSEVYAHVQRWSSLGLEYTDETIYSDAVESEDIYGVEGILTETLSNTMDEINNVFGQIGLKETYLK
ncbi:hypothetical protein MIZ03_0592 [Rhodoferax lithotrophicus]|uniref:Uncharacterized protein n=1 Tax=Rhodoferax lithotrophicus TaxID=2798804 RepID=A0ABM7MHL3_9BURK|nr:hypothetical protein [Rhodoferax sp. MIZ03]BCO25713.1 hypothetical protein MIZ03_0592 [Rhodoferax sp. MIZ03]